MELFFNRTSEKIDRQIRSTIFSKAPDFYHIPSLVQAPEMATILWEIERAFEKGIEPEKVKGGTTEAYFLKDCEGERIAIFKPCEVNDPRARNEVAAFRLDHERFAGVPPTVLTTLTHPLFKGKVTGSCQQIIDEAVALTRIDVQFLLPSQIRRLACLDIRLLNADRHRGNVLVREEKLYPIDHSIALPSLFIRVFFFWLEWKQAKTPFSKREKEYVLRLDPKKDREMLIHELGIDSRSAFLSWLATSLLKKGVERNLTPFQIGRLFAQKEGVETPFKILSHQVLEFPVKQEEVSQELERLIDHALSQY